MLKTTSLTLWRHKPDQHKWQLLQSYQQSLVVSAGDIREQPEHWINVVNIEPSVENLQSLSVCISRDLA